MVLLIIVILTKPHHENLFVSVLVLLRNINHSIRLLHALNDIVMTFKTEAQCVDHALAVQNHNIDHAGIYHLNC